MNMFYLRPAKYLQIETGYSYFDVGGSYTPPSTSPAAIAPSAVNIPLASGNTVSYDPRTVANTITSTLSANPTAVVSDIMIPASVFNPAGEAVSTPEFAVDEQGMVRFSELVNADTSVAPTIANLTGVNPAAMLSRQQAPTQAPPPTAPEAPSAPTPADTARDINMQAPLEEAIPDYLVASSGYRGGTPSAPGEVLPVARIAKPEELTTATSTTTKGLTPEQVLANVINPSARTGQTATTGELTPEQVRQLGGTVAQQPAQTSAVPAIQAPVSTTSPTGQPLLSPEALSTVTKPVKPEGAPESKVFDVWNNAGLPVPKTRADGEKAIELYVAEGQLGTKEERAAALASAKQLRASLPLIENTEKAGYSATLLAQERRIADIEAQITNPASGITTEGVQLVQSEIAALKKKIEAYKNDPNISRSSVMDAEAKVSELEQYRTRYENTVVKDNFWKKQYFLKDKSEWNGANVAMAFGMGLSVLSLAAKVYQDEKTLKMQMKAAEDEREFRERMLQMQLDAAYGARGGGGGGGNERRGGRIGADTEVRL